MITCGFFNSMDHDRLYNAEQMSAIFDGLIHDGVFDSIGEIFATVPGEGLQVIVKTGKAWFDHTWTLNDTALPINLAPADVTRPRYDAVVLEVNRDDAVRENTIKVITGTAAVNPTKPTMVRGDLVNQYPLAYVLVPAAATSIVASNIEIRVGRDDCPFVSGIISSVDISDLFNQWGGEFQTWFDNIQAQLEGDIAANLQRQIDDLGTRITTETTTLGNRITTEQALDVKVANQATDAEAKAGAATNKWMSPARTAAYVSNRLATTAQAQAGTDTSKLMTPALVKSAIGSFSGVQRTLLTSYNFTRAAATGSSVSARYGNGVAVSTLKKYPIVVMETTHTSFTTNSESNYNSLSGYLLIDDSGTSGLRLFNYIGHYSTAYTVPAATLFTVLLSSGRYFHTGQDYLTIWAPRYSSSFSSSSSSSSNINIPDGNNVGKLYIDGNNKTAFTGTVKIYGISITA